MQLKVPLTRVPVCIVCECVLNSPYFWLKIFEQGGHGTGKTGNLFFTISRQGIHREFCLNMENFGDTGKIFWLWLLILEVSFFWISQIFCLASLTITASFEVLLQFTPSWHKFLTCVFTHYLSISMYSQSVIW